ncbi:ABC transporter permease [Arthrobacter sp. B2a2-09]|uniref:ABC transporter permease n=1 Tax=Arthrobacter sp. B2a2-09 TaxID=2952822 RepID=UPI0022CDB0BC|nr:ABC transporter permease [Arthrobacter sp. B2a2-09]MCZ9880460.1 ABC transporter permease [Arthrobacter sp. B2a2-09]
MTVTETRSTVRGGRRPKLAGGRLVTTISLAVLAIIVLVALTGHWMAPYDPTAQDVKLGSTSPSGAHWLGTDALGRDVLSRLMVATRIALLAPVLIALGTTVIGTSLGLLAGYRRGWPDAILMRLTDLMYALPGLLILIVIVGVAGSSYAVAIIALIVLGSPADIRVIRSLAMGQRELAYVDAARTLGLTNRRIMLRHLLPNLAPTVTANLLLSFVYALGALAGLSFLGIGLPAGTADWGLMIQENFKLLHVNPWASVAPAVLITITATAATVLGDAVFERLSAGKSVSQ